MGKRDLKPRAGEVVAHVAPVVAVCADPPDDLGLLKAAARIAVDVDLPFLEKPKARSSAFDMLLVVTAQRLELRVLRGDAALKGGKPVAVELAELDVRSAAGRSLKQPLFKALGVKKLKDLPLAVIDATAGWGGDAWLMAALGCRVLAVERNRVVATLLRDGVLRAGVAPGNDPSVLQRLHVLNTDSRHMLRRIARRHEEPPEGLPAELRDFFEPEVVYLDPMFPEVGRKTAEKKPMRVLRALVGDDGDAMEMFDWAMRVATRRVVVKRPVKAPPISGDHLKPTTAFKGKGFRFDVYALKRGR